jgi:hypothetical protein
MQIKLIAIVSIQVTDSKFLDKCSALNLYGRTSSEKWCLKTVLSNSICEYSGLKSCNYYHALSTELGISITCNSDTVDQLNCTTIGLMPQVWNGYAAVLDFGVYLI